jgi:hypothetical protein
LVFSGGIIEIQKWFIGSNKLIAIGRFSSTFLWRAKKSSKRNLARAPLDSLPDGFFVAGEKLAA